MVGFEPTTLTPQRSLQLNDFGYLQTGPTAQNREEPQIPACPMAALRLAGEPGTPGISLAARGFGGIASRVRVGQGWIRGGL